MLLRACLSGRIGLEPSMADGNITVEVSTQAAQAELERLRAENAALKVTGWPARASPVEAVLLHAGTGGRAQRAGELTRKT